MSMGSRPSLRAPKPCRERGKQVAGLGYVNVGKRYLPPEKNSERRRNMTHIPLPDGLPGIRGAFAFRPETAKPMRELAHVLLHEPNSLTPDERELIATHVSSQNDCYFCQTSHGAAAACHLGGDDVVRHVKADF